MYLKELPVGSKGKIVGFGKEHPEYRRRLVMLGPLMSSASLPSATRLKFESAAASSAFAAMKPL